jgi:hypothetical protein
MVLERLNEPYRLRIPETRYLRHATFGRPNRKPLLHASLITLSPIRYTAICYALSMVCVIGHCRDRPEAYFPLGHHGILPIDRV